MANDDKKKTELLDKLEEGPWPSFVKEIKKAAETSAVCDDLLGQLELSYEEKKGHWKHGGIVGVLGYGGGVIGRYSDVPDRFPKVAHFHTLRVNQPSSPHVQPGPSGRPPSTESNRSRLWQSNACSAATATRSVPQ
jgi:hypothetical protein